MEHDVTNLRNEGNILLLGDFNLRITTNQAMILSNDSIPNSLCLDGDFVLDGRYKRNSEDFVDNLFGADIIKLCSCQDLIICNGLVK